MAGNLAETRLASSPTILDRYAVAYDEDPLALDPRDLAARVGEASKAVGQCDGIGYNSIEALAWIERHLYVSSDGSVIDQVFPFVLCEYLVVAKGGDTPYELWDYLGNQGGLEVYTRGANARNATLEEYGLTLAARADWLICKDVCIPGGADVKLTLPVRDTASPSRRAAQFAAMRALVPQPMELAGAAAVIEDNRIRLSFAPRGAATRFEFFPLQEARIEAAARQITAFEGGNAVLLLTAARLRPTNSAILSCVSPNSSTSAA